MLCKTRHLTSYVDKFRTEERKRAIEKEYREKLLALAKKEVEGNQVLEATLTVANITDKPGSILGYSQSVRVSLTRRRMVVYHTHYNAVISTGKTILPTRGNMVEKISAQEFYAMITKLADDVEAGLKVVDVTITEDGKETKYGSEVLKAGRHIAQAHLSTHTNRLLAKSKLKEAARRLVAEGKLKDLAEAAAATGSVATLSKDAFDRDFDALTPEETKDEELARALYSQVNAEKAKEQEKKDYDNIQKTLSNIIQKVATTTSTTTTDATMVAKKAGEPITGLPPRPKAPSQPPPPAEP